MVDGLPFTYEEPQRRMRQLSCMTTENANPKLRKNT